MPEDVLSFSADAIFRGRFPGGCDKSNIDLFNAGAVAATIRSSLGTKVDVLQKNLSVVSPLR